MLRNVNFVVALIVFLSSITLPLVSGVVSRVDAHDGLEAGPITTIFVLRHADRDKEGNLTEEGNARALDLVHVVGSVGIMGIYTTDFGRTRGTVHPLAVCLGIQPEIYGRDIKALTYEVMSKHRGEQTLIVGHDSTLKSIIEAFVGREIERNIGVQFDDLHIVTIDPTGKGTVVSIKYGKPLGRMKCKK
jgi:2,3-bisphosphoglycerate-dependent phosphoglycerate mutase